MDFALRNEDALARESELEQELESNAREANAETWVSSIMKMSIGACPPMRSTDHEDRFKITPDAFAAMDLQSPFEAMLASQICSLFTHVQATLRDAALARDTEKKLAYYNLASKLNATQVRSTEALYKLKNKGQQKVTVEHVQIEDGHQKAQGRRVTVETTNTADGSELDSELSGLANRPRLTISAVSNGEAPVDIKIRPKDRSRNVSK